MSCKSIVLDGVDKVAGGVEEKWDARLLLYSENPLISHPHAGGKGHSGCRPRRQVDSWSDDYFGLVHAVDRYARPDLTSSSLKPRARLSDCDA